MYELTPGARAVNVVHGAAWPVAPTMSPWAYLGAGGGLATLRRAIVPGGRAP